MSHIQFQLQRTVRPHGRTGAFGLLFLVGSVALGLAGCQHEVAKPPPPKPPEVMVAIPIEETVTEFEEVTGRTWAINTIDVRARVSGYLDKVYFKDGGEVKAGDVLFEIDQRPFKADLDKAIASVKQAESHLERLVRQEERMKQLLPSKAITKDEYEAITFERAEADAALAAARASEETAQLNLGFTRVTSRISGTIGRRLIDPGNLVKADETPLAAVVSLNPIYAYFDLDERTVLRLRRMIQSGTVKSPQDVELPAQVAVADDPNYTMTGIINFIDNQLDGSTGTLRGRAVVQNHDGLLSPGLFVRLRVPIGAPHKAVLVREEALGSDQGQRFVYVVEKVKNKDTGVEEDVVAYRRVQIGMLLGGRRVIESGLELNERVIVTGLQRVRPGAKVQAKMVDQDGKAIAQAEPQAEPAAQKTADVAHGSGK
ncbi:MAG: efflux RND transporter periplasmic adaptor subunit [Planctomycetota bacterium]